MDEKLKQDIKVIRLRKSLDPTRFYKNPDKMKSILHVGTVIEGPTEFKSGRLTKRERKQSILEEIIADKKIRSYSKRKFLQIQDVKSNKFKDYKVPKKAPKKSIKHKKVKALV